MRTYVVGEEAHSTAYDEHGPEDVQTLQDDHQTVEEVKTDEGRVKGQGINPRRVHDPGPVTKNKNRDSSQSDPNAHCQKETIDKRTQGDALQTQ